MFTDGVAEIRSASRRPAVGQVLGSRAGGVFTEILSGQRQPAASVDEELLESALRRLCFA